MVVYLEIDSVLPKELAERAEFTDKYLRLAGSRAYIRKACAFLLAYCRNGCRRKVLKKDMT